jgi:DNA polymerase-3 subunit alpha
MFFKTDYSILASLLKTNDSIDFLKKKNITTIGIVDDNLSYVMEYYNELKKNNIKLIPGLEITIEDKTIYLYAKNYEGYQNLCYISSNPITIDNIKNNSSNLIMVLPYKSKDLYNEFNLPDTYLAFNESDEIDYSFKNIYLNIVRCLNKEDLEYLKYLELIKQGKSISEDISIEEDYYKDIELDKSILDNYNEINNLCNFNIDKQDLLPKYDFINEDSKSYLEKLCKKGLMKRFNNKVPIKYADRLMMELDVINNMGFNDYFLVVWDYVKFAKKNNILVGPGRGSAAGSLVSYSLGITDIDPIKYDLLFERFLNKDRITMPDIDIDFDSNRKEEVVNYVISKYGRKRVCNIITYGTMKSKMVLRDVGRIFNLEDKMDSFIKYIDSNMSLKENLDNINIKNMIEKDPLLSKVCMISLKLEGLKRLTSVHAAGVIISNKDLDRYIPLYDNNGTLVSGYTMNYIEELGLLKMDFLSLDNLILISNLCNEIKDININTIPLNDEKTLDVFRKVNTDGIFQFESSGIKNVLRKFRVDNFDDLAVILALFRPGPMQNIDSYIKRKEGKEKVTYVSDSVKEILESTYGIIIYQEQIMKIAEKMAGFTLSEADNLRRAMSKKKIELMKSYQDKFIEGSIKNNYSKEDAEKTFDYILKFASYGFNKSHSVSYSLISYQMAYLKAHYPSYFMKYLLSNVIGNEIKTKEYIDECKLNNINILMPDINKSNKEYTLEDNGIRFPLASIKNIGSTISNTIIEERNNGDYKDFIDFITRTYSKGVNKKVLTTLILSGCFDSFNNRKTLIDNLDSIINYAELVKDLDSSLVDKPDIDIKEEYSKDELINMEYDSFGFYLSMHPVQKYRDNNITTNNIKNYFNKTITIYLLVDKKREINTKNNDKMLFLTGSDEYNSIELVVFPKVYESFYNITRGEVYKFLANVEKRNSSYQLIVKSIEKVEN